MMSLDGATRNENLEEFNHKDAWSPASGKTSDNFAARLTLITLMSLALYVAVAFFWPKFSRAEVFFAECAREMIATSNYVTPLYHGVGFFDKPILCYWFIIGCFKTLGTTHFVARIPSIIASLLTIVVTAVGCRAAFGARPALYAAAILASSFMYLSFSALCMSDTSLVLCDTLTLMLLYAGLKLPQVVKQTAWWQRRGMLWLMGAVSMGIGFLVKGPVAVVLPAACFLTFLLITKQLKTIRPQYLLVGGLVATAIALPWFLAAYQANGMDAIIYFFIRENVQRFAGATYDTHKPFWFMVVSLMGGFLPWSLFLPPVLTIAFQRVWKDRASTSISAEQKQSNEMMLYMMLWTAVLIGFFSCSRGKIDYYALPVFPFCSIMIAVHLNQWIESSNKLAIGFASLLNSALVIAGVGLGFFVASIPNSNVVSGLAMAIVPVAIGAIGLWQITRRRLNASFIAVFAGIMLTGIVYSAVAMPPLIRMLPALQYAESIKAVSSTAAIGMYTGVENWVDEVTFRTAREPQKINNAEELSAFARTSGSWLMIKNGDFDKLPADVRNKIEVVERAPFIPKSINPGYLFKNRKNLTGGSELILGRTR